MTQIYGNEDIIVEFDSENICKRICIKT